MNFNNYLINFVFTFLDLKPCKLKIFELIKENDLTSVYKLELKMKSSKIKYRSSAIVKICKYPLDKEIRLYRLLNNYHSQIIPEIYYSKQKEKFCVLIMENLGDIQLKNYITNQNLLIESLSKMMLLHDFYCYKRKECIKAISYNKNICHCKNNFISSIKDLKYFINKKKINKIMDIYQDFIKHIYNYRMTLIHGDLYADNIIIKGKKLYFIDWGFADWGCEFIDIASLLDLNERKNGINKLSFDQKIMIYSNAHFLARKEKIIKKKAACDLITGKILLDINMVNWMIYKINMNYWNISNVKWKIEQLIDSIGDNISLFTFYK